MRKNWIDESNQLLKAFVKRPADIGRALGCARECCDLFDSLVGDAAQAAAKQNLTGICICAFGSPARYEMLGQSDLDCLIVRRNNINAQAFRNNFLSSLARLGFSKVDVPEWGSLADCENYLRTAITEGNQVVEARFIVGDRSVWKALTDLRRRYCTAERFRITFCFHYHYFTQYYSQRERKGQRNLKYGDGGTRDFIFPLWLAYLRDGLDAVQDSRRAFVETSLTSISRHGEITDRECSTLMKAANTIAFLRNELLRVTEGTSDSGLTYLYPESAMRVAQLWPNLRLEGMKMYRQGTRNADRIHRLKKLCYRVFAKEKDVIGRLGSNDPGDELSAIELSWAADLGRLPADMLSTLVGNTSWSVSTSLACNPTCTPDILDVLAARGMSEGYEYILKVVARNPGTTNATLVRIAESGVESRFTEPARVRLSMGWNRANEL